MKIPEITATLTQEELWRYVVNALDAGDFTWLDKLLKTQNYASIIPFLKANGEPKLYMEEAFAWACFVGRTGEAATLLDKGIDPVAGNRTGQTGFHYAVMGGHLDTIELLIERKVPMEVRNMYNGTVLGQALYSAVLEHLDSHAAIIKALIEAGAEIEPGTLEWWEKQDVPSAKTKERVAAALGRSETK